MKRQKMNVSVAWIVAALIWYIINIRVEAGIATAFERAIDGLVGGAVLLIILYYAARFFKFLNLASLITKLYQ